MTINVSLPKDWTELTQEQLRFLLMMMVAVNHSNRHVGYDSREDYAIQTSVQVQTLCFFKWSGLTVICPYDDGYLLKSGDTEFSLDTDTLTSAIAHLAWIKEPPKFPVRLDTVNKAKAIPADISSGLSFDSWLACETLWQQYLSSLDDSMLKQMAAILYRKEDIKPDPAETLGIFYWWSGVKALVSEMFPNFFKKVGNESEPESPTYDEIRRNIDAQIRALTKGDITKEREILALDAMRALTELDAQAREYDELRNKYPAK